MKNHLSSPLVQMALLFLFVFGLDKAITTNNNSLATLTVQGVQAVATTSTVDTLSALYPLVAESKERNSNAAPISDEISIDQAFIPRRIEPMTPVISSAPDYFLLLKDHRVMTLTAITDSGAVINDKYYTFDTAIADYAYPGSGKQMETPILRRSAKNPTAEIVIAEPGGTKTRRFALTIAR
jgi:hypothetical protein